MADALLLILGEKTYLLFEKNEDTIWGEDATLTNEDKLQSKEIIFEPRDRFQEIVRGHLNEFDRIAVSLDRDHDTDAALLATLSYDRKLRERKGPPVTLCDSRTLVGTLRHIKSREEILDLKEAAARSSKVHTALMRKPLVEKTERQICNFIEAGFLMEDMQWTSYETIVGSGYRSTLLHARASDRIIENGDTVLIDAGGEWNGYCADITRVIPAGPKFSAEQKQVYGAVLAAQKAAIAVVRPRTSLPEIHHLTKEVLVDELLRLGLAENLVRENMLSLMPHSTSHWLGLDVHDPSPHYDDSGNAIRLAAGMCFTIEPGLYFSRPDIFEKYHGIGVRIEDDILVTETGYEILTDVPKEVEEIEQLRSQV